MNECFLFIYCHGTIITDHVPIKVPDNINIIKKNISACGYQSASVRENESYDVYLQRLKEDMLRDFNTCVTSDEFINCRKRKADYEYCEKNSCVIQYSKREYLMKMFITDKTREYLQNMIFVIKKPDGTIEEYNLFNIEDIHQLISNYCDDFNRSVYSFLDKMGEKEARRTDKKGNKIIKKISIIELFQLFTFLPFSTIKILDFSCNTFQSKKGNSINREDYTYNEQYGYGFNKSKKSKKSKKNKRRKTRVRK